MGDPNTQFEASGSDPQVKYCVTAVIDLLGFSSHLEIGGNDLRTNIGQEAIKRLQILENALRLMNDERALCKDEYPKEFYQMRINDALILTLDLPIFFTPSVGEAIKRGISAKEIDQFFDLDSIGSGEFEQAYEARVSQEIADLVRFVGLIARLHHYVNRKENSAFFPGAKTVIATGYRRTFLVNGTEDFLAANFAFSNAYLAEKDLHGPRLFLDDNIVELLSSNRFARNLLRFASYVQSAGSFDLFQENDDMSIGRTKSEPIAVTLFRKPFSFRELDSSIVAYVQLIPRLSPYLMGEKEPKGKSTFRILFHAIKKGLSATELSETVAPKFPVRLLNDIEFDIRIPAELMESGNSVIGEEQFERKRREDMVRAIAINVAPNNAA